MIPELESTGFLPRGRYVCTLEEARDRFVLHQDFALSSRRRELWDEFSALYQLLQRKINVPAAFIAGSFVSAKLNPSDVDASFIVDGDSIRHPAAWDVINKIAYAATSRTPLGQHGTLRVDSFLVPWTARASEGELDETYLSGRGKWDDWWQRRVEKSDRGSPRRSHALPVVGYLEVIIDGYR